MADCDDSVTADTEQTLKIESDERTKRISQAAIGEEENLPDFYAAASLVARGVLESSQKIAGTTYCKGV